MSLEHTHTKEKKIMDVLEVLSSKTGNQSFKISICTRKSTANGI